MANDLQVTGGITQALLDALNQMESAVAAQLVNPDGTPSGSAVYMHLPIGHSVEPKMFANPWTLAGGSAYANQRNDGTFAASPAPAPAATPAPAGGPNAAPPGATPAQQTAAASTADPKLASAINSAYNTARLVDDMLMVTNKGVAVAWPQRTVSIEYFTALSGMQAEPVPPPPEATQKRIDDAQKTLYLMDADGNFTGYTPRYAMYRRNLKALADARSAYALAYGVAQSDPASGQTWPVTSAKYQADVDNAYNDWRDMGGQQVEDAISTLQAIGGSAAAALIAKARKMYQSYSIGLAGAVAEQVPWSYIDPVSWWDHTNQDFGVMHIEASSQRYQGTGGGSSNSYAHQFYDNQSSTTSGSAGFDVVLYSASVDASHSETSHDDGTVTNKTNRTQCSDQSSFAKVKMEWFLATIERPWLLGDLFHMDGWYLVGQKKGAISDGTIDGQLGDTPKLLPMIPKAFVIVRNVSITADSWGEAGSSFENASSSTSGHTDSSSNSWGGSVGYLCFDGSVQHQDAQDSGAFTQQSDASHGWSFKKTAEGGTLELYGSQIVGWIGQIQPEAPRKDDPALQQN